MAPVCRIFRHIQIPDNTGCSFGIQRLLNAAIGPRVQKQNLTTHCQNFRRVQKGTISKANRTQYIQRRAKRSAERAETRVSRRGRITKHDRPVAGRRTEENASSVEEEHFSPRGEAASCSGNNATQKYQVDATGNSQASPTTRKPVGELEGQEKIDRAIEFRDKLENQLQQKQHMLEQNRQNYWWMRNLHESGEDPGLPGWTPAWNAEDFDREHLRQSMLMSGNVVEAENLVWRMWDVCARLGIDPSEHQVSRFRRDDWSESMSMEGARIASAPRETIGLWLDGLPQDRRALAAATAARDSRFSSSPYPEEHLVEYPDDMDLTCGPDLDPCDSFSATNDEVKRLVVYPGHMENNKLVLDAYPLNDNLGQRPRWTAPVDLEQRVLAVNVEGTMHLRSHMC
jgi:hypothetical protein